jgi:hypothetical protein
MPSEYALAAAKFFVSTEFNGWFGTSPIDYTGWAPDGEDTQIANELAGIIDNEIRPLIDENRRLCAYARYIGETMERIAEGWVPVCYEEFIESEECENYLAEE